MPEDRPPVTLRGFRPADVPFVSSIVAEALHEHYDPSLYLSLSAEWPEGSSSPPTRSTCPVGFLLGVNQVEGEGRVLMFAVDRDHRALGRRDLLMDDVPRPMPRARAPTGDAGGAGLGTRPRSDSTPGTGSPSSTCCEGYYSDGENGYQMARPPSPETGAADPQSLKPRRRMVRHARYMAHRRGTDDRASGDRPARRPALPRARPDAQSRRSTRSRSSRPAASSA